MPRKAYRYYTLITDNALFRWVRNRYTLSVAIGNRIKEAREAANLKKTQLARLVGVTKGAVGNWEAEGRAAPSTENLAKIASALNVSFEWLATGRGPMRLAEAAAKTGPAVLEQELLAQFRRQPARRKTAIIELLKTL